MRVLTGAQLACGGWVLARTQEERIAALDFEFARAACVEMDAGLMGCGLELSQDLHLPMAELCHCTKNLIETKAFDIACVDLVVDTAESLEAVPRRVAVGAAGLILSVDSGPAQPASTRP